MRRLCILSLILCLAASTGCNVCCWGKRNSELAAPTDIRKAHFWCLGEDAIFEQPCGPSKEDYGLKATCWREWPADGGKCKPGTCPPGTTCGPGGTCGPAMLPANLPQHATPTWEESAPTEIIEGPNPFRDDELLPTPPTSGAAPRAPRFNAQSAASSQGPRVPQQQTTNVSLPARDMQLSSKQLSVSDALVLPSLATANPATAKLGAGKLPTVVTAKPSQSDRTLKIEVSEPLAAPVRSLAPIRTPGDLPKLSDSRQEQPHLQAETLAGLERMVEVPTTRPTAEAQPLQVRNDYAPQSKPFHLATRTSITRAANDPAVKKETLSALESMISNGGGSTSVK